MEWRNFLSNMTTALAWPVVAACLLFLLRKELPALLKRIKAASVGNAKLEFDNALDDAKDSADALKTPETAKEMRAAPTSEYLNLANEHPEAAVIDCYAEVEKRLIEIRKRLNLPPRVNLPGVVNELVDRKLLDQDGKQLFVSLRRARNAAAHTDNDHRITPGEAVDFTHQSWVLVALLDKLLKS